MDRELLLKINQEWTHPILDRIMVGFSSFPLWTPFLIALVIILAWKGTWRVRLFLIVLGLTIGVNDGLVARTLKHTVNRPRPHQTELGLVTRSMNREGIPQVAIFKPIRIRDSKPSKKGPSEGRSFPSAHTMNTFAAATATFLCFGRWWWLLYLPAGLVAYSRVYTCSHWPSDIPPSIAMGIFFGWLVPTLLNRVWKAYATRFHPLCPDLLRQTPPPASSPIAVEN
ncbi:MAG: undecaprenyl-diphosphatase [Verrucomicrobiales bacterium]